MEMDRYIFLGLFTITNVILIASADCPTALCKCIEGAYICDVKNDGITVADLTTIIANANTDGATELKITKYLGTTLTSEMFKSTPKLTKLTVKDSPAVTTIDADAFKGLLALTELHIMGTSVTTLPETVFTPLATSLTDLMLMENAKLASIQVNIFKGLTKLKTLDLTQNPMTSLDALIFTGLIAVVDLTISKTSITTLPETIFAPLRATLGQLLMADNSKLATLPDNIFKGLTQLTVLDLQMNALKSFSPSLFNDVRTASIDTSGNPVDCSCGNILGLIDFVASNNKLTVMCTTPANMKDKELKSVTKADVCPCPTALCTCESTQYTCNKKVAGITEEELTTAILPNLLNTVTTMTITTYLGTTLKAGVFNASTTKIKFLAIENSPALTALDVNAFSGMTALASLSISGTSVTTLPDLVFDIVKPTLEDLVVKGNKELATLPNTVFMGLTKLTTLDLSNNAINSFSASLFDSIKTAKISVAGNPVDCSCNDDTAGLIPWIKANPNAITTALACDSPALLKDKDLKEQTIEAICPCPSTLCTCTGANFTCDKVADGITEEDLTSKILPQLMNFGGKLKITTFLGESFKEDVFKSAPKITRLSIDDSAALTTIDENAFKGLTALVVIRITGTSIKSLPELIFSPIKGTLMELYIQKNKKLTNLPEKAFTGLAKLTKLDLTDNAIESFTARMFDDVKQATINTAGNPVDCSCNDNITGLIKWMTDNPDHKLAINCTMPDAMKGKDLKSLTKVDICASDPNPTPHSPAGGVGIPNWALGILIAAIIAIVIIVVASILMTVRRQHYEKLTSSNEGAGEMPLGAQ
ncbi:slit homolog 2 protein-like [Lineus longissimus]|uniref:slit homolog 2 protein-like n=1 Tax=Lineus longissimus TaxID=88925 RepID=UPI00315D617E